jgi:RNA polymerase sigma factor (sigma-70 family)
MGGAIQLMTAEVTEPPDGGATDDDLVSLATQGNRAAFEALLRRHYDLMHRVAWRMTGSQTDAQDICQDVCCALVERIASFRGEAKFTTWLVGIVRNACHDHHRRHSTLTRLKGHLAVLAEMAAPPDGRDLFRRSWLASELARLSPLLRETVVLVVGEGMTHAEAATALGVSESTISGRLRRMHVPRLCNRRCGASIKKTPGTAKECRLTSVSSSEPPRPCGRHARGLS